MRQRAHSRAGALTAPPPPPPLAARRHRRCRSAAARPAGPTPAAGQPPLPPPVSPPRRLDAAGIAAFAAGSPSLAAHLGAARPGDLRCEELLDGVINCVWRVEGPSGAAAIVKQALPWVRAVGESFPLSVERQAVEAAAMALLSPAAPAHVPRLLAHDGGAALLAMAAVPPPAGKLRHAIAAGAPLPGLGGQLGRMLAALHARASLELLSPGDAEAVAAAFANRDIVAANERVVLIAPFDPDDASNAWLPALDRDVAALWADGTARAQAADLLAVYRCQREALIHNDCHTGNLLTSPGGGLWLIDWEFATTAPVSFDLGTLLGVLMMTLICLAAPDAPARGAGGGGGGREQAERLLQELRELWEGYRRHHPHELEAARAAGARDGAHVLWPGVLAAASGPAPRGGGGGRGGGAWDGRRWRQVLLDSCGFAGCALIRLTVGLHKHPDLQSVDGAAARVVASRRCLALGRRLLALRARREQADLGDVLDLPPSPIFSVPGASAAIHIMSTPRVRLALLVAALAAMLPSDAEGCFLPAASSVALGDSAVCVLQADGTPLCAGCPASMGGVCGAANPLVPPPAGMRFKALTMPIDNLEASFPYKPANKKACGILFNSTIACWGTPTDLGPLAGVAVRQISFTDSVGTFTLCAILDDADGSVACVGLLQPPQPIKGAVDVAVTVFSACAVLRGGGVTCWGCGGGGSPCVPPGAGNASEVALAAIYACTLGSATGSPACWPTDTGITAPPAWLRGLSGLSVISGSACALRSSEGVPACWGEDLYRNGVTSPPALGQRAVAVGLGGPVIACAVLANHQLACWGEQAFVTAVNSTLCTISTPTCAQACKNGGNCTAPNFCSCPPGWGGPDCSVRVSCKSPCLRGSCALPPGSSDPAAARCDCFGTGYSGDTCSVPVCEPPCATGQLCVTPGTCTCPAGTTGINCTTPVCAQPCANNGTCTLLSSDGGATGAGSACSCVNGWAGDSCSVKGDAAALGRSNGQALHCLAGPLTRAADAPLPPPTRAPQLRAGVAKLGNDGSVSCDKFCVGFGAGKATWGSPFEAHKGCVTAFDFATSPRKEVACAATRAPTADPAKGVVCICTPYEAPLVLPPNTGTCKQTCNTVAWPDKPRSSFDVGAAANILLGIVQVGLTLLQGPAGAAEGSAAEGIVEATLEDAVGVAAITKAATAEGNDAQALQRFVDDFVAKYKAEAAELAGTLGKDADALDVVALLKGLGPDASPYNSLVAEADTLVDDFTDMIDKVALKLDMTDEQDEHLLAKAYANSLNLPDTFKNTYLLTKFPGLGRRAADGAGEDSDGGAAPTAAARAGGPAASSWEEYNLAGYIRAEGDYMICTLRQTLSEELLPQIAWLAEADLRHFNEQVNTTLFDLVAHCPSWNCLNFTDLAPSKVNAAAGELCTKGYLQAKADAARCDAAPAWNGSYNAVSCKTAGGMDGLCDPSDGLCYVQSVTVTDGVDQGSSNTAISFLRAKVSYFMGSAGPSGEFATLEQYNSPDAAQAYIKGTMLYLALLQQLALFGDQTVLDSYAAQARAAAAYLDNFLASYLDDDRLAAVVDKLSYTTGYLRFQSPDVDQPSCNDCMDPSWGGPSPPSPVTQQVYSPSTGQQSAVASGALVVQWGCAVGQALNQSVLCPSGAHGFTGCVQHDRCCHVDGMPFYSYGCLVQQSVLKGECNAGFGAALSAATGAAPPPGAADLADDFSNLDAVNAGTVSPAFKALKAQAVRALKAKLTADLAYVGRAADNFRALANASIPEYLIGAHPAPPPPGRRGRCAGGGAPGGAPGALPDAALPAPAPRRRAGRYNPANGPGYFYPLGRCASTFNITTSPLQQGAPFARPPPPACSPEDAPRLVKSGITTHALCGAGRFMDYTGCCSACPSGTFKARAGNAPRCAPCGGPGAVSAPGARKASACACGKGYFRTSAPGAPALTCGACPAGLSTKGRGAASAAECTLCAPGHFKADGACKPCSVGSFCPRSDAPTGTTRTACPAGTTTRGAGASGPKQCNWCQEGWHSATGAAPLACKRCADGTCCPRDAKAPGGTRKEPCGGTGRRLLTQ
ncbi:MTK1 [Scenedesmus sp. PABB004]|nr:MTK1 [Scenedesmus sp. PABB004]